MIARMHLRSTNGRRSDQLSAIGLASIVGGAGILHFAATGAFAKIVPHFLPNPEGLVRVSGVMELGIATMLVVPTTRRKGAFLAAALLVAVFPANVQMALDGGIRGAGFPLNSPAIAWARLPLQVPLVVWALHIARRSR